MSDDIPEDELEDSRAALAPTLEATAAILPWLDKPRALRFDKQLNSRWVAACTRLSIAWSGRHAHLDGGDLRPAIFNLYTVALETADSDCLMLGEALASAADRLENTPALAKLVASLSATIECLTEESGLEHVLFPERARHFAQRLGNALNATDADRSPVADRLFVGEAREKLERMQDALTALPPDAYALRLESRELAQQAEALELYGIVHLARQFDQSIPGNDSEIDEPRHRTTLENLLHQLTVALAAIPT